MKNINYLLIITLVLSVVFAACKYDEGPGISLKQKRERVSNAWRVTNCLVDGVSYPTLLASFSHGASANTPDSLVVVLNIYQGGSYGIALDYTGDYASRFSPRKHYVANQTGLIAMVFDYRTNSLFKRIGSGGKWTFTDHWKNIDFGANDLSHSEGELKPLSCRIVMLKEKMLKLSYSDGGKSYLLTFEPHHN